MPARVAAHCGRSRYAAEPNAIGQRVPVPERNPRQADPGPKSEPKLEADIETEQWLDSPPKSNPNEFLPDPDGECGPQSKSHISRRGQYCLAHRHGLHAKEGGHADLLQRQRCEHNVDDHRRV